MKETRMLGNRAEQLAAEAGISVKQIGETLGFSETQVLRFFKGKVFLTFKKLEKLANLLGTTVEDLLAGDETAYNNAMRSYTENFEKNENFEQVMDLIDFYLDIEEAVGQT